mmetsp:Transcript_47593/g.132351  ORF Transcript_47593/g.132351 Transcript_47593/m.132351 type:complete len:198 (-) Transcript_47593:208-801(-)
MQLALSSLRNIFVSLQRSALLGASFIRRHPVLSIGTAGSITGALGDILAQRAGNEPFDVRRWLGVTSFSVFDSLVLYYPFYRFLDSCLGPAATARSVAMKVLLDDAMFVPGVEVPLFFTWTSLAEGDSVLRRLKSEYKETVIVGWMFNVPISIVNFTLVPPAFRVIFGDAADLGSSALMSYMSHRAEPSLRTDALCL